MTAIACGPSKGCECPPVAWYCVCDASKPPVTEAARALSSPPPVPDTAALVQRLTELRDAATPGPWRQDDEFPDEIVSSLCIHVAEVEIEADAALIVAVVNALPELLTALRGEQL